MKFRHTFEVTPDWETRLEDPVAVIHCIPGVESVQQSSEDSYDLKVTTGLGPVRLRMEGAAHIERPGKAHLVADVTLKERIAGTIYGRFTLQQEEERTVAIEADVTLGGRLGEFAQPLLRKKASDIVIGFQENFLKLLAQ